MRITRKLGAVLAAAAMAASLAGCGAGKETLDLAAYRTQADGFSFTNYNAHEMLGAIRYAEEIYYDRKRSWNKIAERAMKADFSWSHSAKEYEKLYDEM